MERIICHWTAGAHRATATDRKHYHFIFEADGREVVGNLPIEANASPIRGAYAAHTLHCNSGSIGLSMACMRGATENPLNYGPSPMTWLQWDAMCRKAAELCVAYNIPVTPRTVLSHAEVQGTLGIRQRGKWDFTVLPFDTSLRGAKACGDRLRADVKAHVAKLLRPVAFADLPDGEIETALRVDGSRTIAGADAIAGGTVWSRVWAFLSGGGGLTALPYFGQLPVIVQIIVALAIIAAAEAPEMSDEDALNGIDFARLVGFPLDGLPDDADPHKATAFFESLGLSADFTGMDFDAAPAPASADDDAAKTHSGDGGHVAV